jgi:hypothetical protein
MSVATSRSRSLPSTHVQINVSQSVLVIMSLPQKLEFVMGIMIKQGVVSHTVALPFTLNSSLKSKRRIMETQIFSPCKNIIFNKIL